MPTVTDRVASFSSKLRTRLVVRAATPLDQADVDLVLDVLVMRFALLFDLSVGSTQAEVTAGWERTVLGLTDLDVELYSSDWKELREILVSPQFRRQISNETDADRLVFKQLATGRIHYRWILNATLALIGGKDWYKRVNQWIVFDSRVNLVSLDLTTQCCREYLDFELTYPTPEIFFSDDSSSIREELNTLVRCATDMFGDFNITDYRFRPKHGNGATREVERRNADSWHKNRHFAVDGEIITYLKHRVPEEEWRDQFYLPYRGLDRTSELVCVPKSMTKNRTISKEPTTLQFLQQDIFRALDDYFDSRPDVRIDLHDQSKSRRLALLGSVDGDYATIDLSNASDSVSVGLLNLLFGSLPCCYPLMATRSDFVHVMSNDKTIDCTIRTKKFAPMGSATCFPVESMVFATICEAAVRRNLGRRSRVDDYVVYGDDIVIRSDCAYTAVHLLEQCGFTVNRSKSFGYDTGQDTLSEKHVFREACGIECFDGEDITPLRLSRRLVSPTNNMSDHQAGLGVGLIDLVNRSFLFGYKTLRRWVNDQLVRHKWYRTCLRLSAADYEEFSADILLKRKSWITCAVPFVITDDLCDTQWRAFAFRSGLADPLHRMSILVSIAKPRKTVTQRHDENDYFSWCLEARNDSVAMEEFSIDDTGIVTIRPRDLKWSKAWVGLQRPARLQLQSK